MEFIGDESPLFSFQSPLIKKKRGWEKGTPYHGQYGEAPPERGGFLRLQVYEMVGH